MERKIETLKQQLFEFEDQVVGADTKKPIRSRIDDLYHIIKCVEQNQEKITSWSQDVDRDLGGLIQWRK